jgi:hypothetical protein
MKERLGQWLGGLVTIYFIIGAVHSAFFWLTVSRKDCLTATGLVAGYCNVGMGWSHGLVVFGWPYYWINSITADDGERLTGNERSDFVIGVSNSCVLSKDRNPVAALMPAKVLEQYCRCYAEGLADDATKKQLREDSVADPVVRSIGHRCAARIPEFQKNSN